MHIDSLDEYDNRILEVIRDNARLSYSEIGEKVGLSRVSVHKRMDRLEKVGVIAGYFTKISSMEAPECRKFFMTVMADPNVLTEALEYVASVDAVHKIYAVSGSSQIFAEGIIPDGGKGEACMRKLRHCQQIKGVSSCVIKEAQYVIRDTDRGIDYVRDELKGTENC